MAHPLAGKPAPKDVLVDVPDLLRRYAAEAPDPANPAERVAFGTSGHRGSAFRAAFNEAHILATTEAICRYRAGMGYTGPLFIGRDTHALLLSHRLCRRAHPDERHRIQSREHRSIVEARRAGQRLEFEGLFRPGVQKTQQFGAQRLAAIARRHDEQPVDDVAQLADIAWPFVGG